MSHSLPFRPKLTVNRAFMQEFIEAETPCFGLGLVEEWNRQCGFLALRPDVAIPAEVSAHGFNFGHSLLGTSFMEVIPLRVRILWISDVQRASQSEQLRGASRVGCHARRGRLFFLCPRPEQSSDRVPCRHHSRVPRRAKIQHVADSEFHDHRPRIPAGSRTVLKEPGTRRNDAQLALL